MNLTSIGQLVQRRRQALGLSQARLAKLSGLSRATINQLETGTIVDLGAAKLMVLLELLGVTLDASERPPRDNALALASRTASVSHKEVLKPEALASAMVEGRLPADITPHVATLPDEAAVADHRGGSGRGGPQHPMPSQDALEACAAADPRPAVASCGLVMTTT